ncbi:MULTISPECIES: DUF2191 domain-containing protein [Nitrosomonas]|uniref:Uncharacterized protein n=1 Tax=Nitrosomonas communis TaxID=44574 RepID=A0A0F7KCH2_9PROT|nr:MULTISPECIES: DUF2191 domain-containing protein [Nitrosomonas]AKH36828.1 hypothetical protein AAW31_01835 [Nitrosomonas communis]TYP78782.1 hypothetical protein BCL69_106811 [Nitrosomonas communis]UVS61920.1 DUF2191 domain-containing protein [Nitrosomonas sp. PLL12]
MDEIGIDNDDSALTGITNLEIEENDIMRTTLYINDELLNKDQHITGLTEKNTLAREVTCLDQARKYLRRYGLKAASQS